MQYETNDYKIKDLKQERLKNMWIMNNKSKVKLGKQKDLISLIACLVVDIQKEKEDNSRNQKELNERIRRAKN
jgi:hypothetical protein